MTNAQLMSPATLGRAGLGWVLGLTSAAYFMVILDSSVVLTALPRMQRDLHAEEAPAAGPGVAAVWRACLDGLGSSLADAGGPVFERRAARNSAAGTLLGGFSVISARDLEAAVRLGLPVPPGWGRCRGRRVHPARRRLRRHHRSRPCPGDAGPALSRPFTGA